MSTSLNDPFRTAPTFSGTHYLELIWDNVCSTTAVYVIVKQNAIFSDSCKERQVCQAIVVFLKPTLPFSRYRYLSHRTSPHLLLFLQYLSPIGAFVLFVRRQRPRRKVSPRLPRGANARRTVCSAVEGKIGICPPPFVARTSETQQQQEAGVS